MGDIYLTPNCAPVISPRRLVDGRSRELHHIFIKVEIYLIVYLLPSSFMQRPERLRGRFSKALSLGLGVGVVAMCASLVVGSMPAVQASSHREAPLISMDPTADATDFYAFVSPDRPDSVTFIANYIPFEEPAGGPNYYGFDPNVMYEIKVDNNADAREDIVYQFRFNTVVRNQNTFLNNTAPITSVSGANVYQTYTLTKVEKGRSMVLARDLPVPPANIGPKSTPDYAALERQAVRTLANGIKVFAGQKDDPFFVDFSLFDLLTIRKLPGNGGEGVDGLKGYNVHALAIQVPINQLTANKQRPTDPKAAHAVIGAWTTASRHSVKVLRDRNWPIQNGRWVQVSRLGAPLVNEVVIPLGKKNVWNNSKPAHDAQFANYVTNPELGGLFKALYNIQVPPQGKFGSKDQRDDLIAIFLTGIPDLTKPVGKVTPAEELRLNVAVRPAATPNAMGVLGGDIAGYPNGRRLADDVTDISLRAVAGAAYPLFHPNFKADETGVKLGDGVDANDKSFVSSFPYLASPHRGFESLPHAGM